MIPLIGYSDRLSVAPGQRIEFKISSLSEQPFHARLVRVRCADPNPDGPGMQEEPVPAHFEGSYPSRYQPIHGGSYARVVNVDPPAPGESFTLSASIWPTRPDTGTTQAVLASWNDANASGYALLLTPSGPALRLGDGNGNGVDVATGAPLRSRTWYHIRASWDARTSRVTVTQRILCGGYRSAETVSHSERLAFEPKLDGGSDLLLAALGGEPVTGHYNGKLEDPALYRGLPALDEHQRLGEASLDELLFGFDFSKGIDTRRVYDLGPRALVGELANAPARAMTGSNWQSDEVCWRHAPQYYGAIHFHDDDLHDCGWQSDFAFDVPKDFRSGVYAVRLECGEHHDNLPFFVRPPRGCTQAKIAVLLPTFTYQVYANFARGNVDDAFHARNRAWGARPWAPDEHPEYGLSTYNRHSDGSGICYASRLRPNLLLRCGYAAVLDPRGSGLRNFPDDTHLTDWLEAMGHAYDIVTDEDLHEEGVDLIRPYKVVLTGSHPEYHTRQTLDALQSYTTNGGRLMYLGGNGFYWKLGISAEEPGLLEIRRAETGMRAWAAEPGEYFNSLDGGYGGLWRRHGRPPQQLVGVGFAGEGPYWGQAYLRQPGADDARARFIFEGVKDTVLGDFGLSGGGAAGFEVDRTEPLLGTPTDALTLASSRGFPEGFMLTMEEWLAEDTTWAGPPADELLRADMIFFETPNGGAVFSVGSISFIGALFHNRYDNNISKIVNNVLSRFETA